MADDFSIDELLERAAACGAGSLLLSVGNPPVARARGQFQTPLSEHSLSFRDTERIARAVLPESLQIALNQQGNVEAPFEIGKVSGTVTVFYGLGSHQLVFHIGQKAQT